MEKVSLILSVVLISAIIVTSCGGGGSGERTSSNDVAIGSQVWMSKNLDVSTFRNGDPISQVKTDEEWIKAGENKQPAWCYYDNDATIGSKYGKLYNWYAVSDPRGLAPIGYHIPTDAEWTILEDYLGSEAGTKMKNTSGWDENGNGSNASGFSGLPGSHRSFNYDEFFSRYIKFNGLGKNGYWWSATENGVIEARCRNITSFDGYVNSPRCFKTNGLSVRCLRD